MGLTQANWRWCNKCQGLLFWGQAVGVCPAGGSHDCTGSNNYAVYMDSAVTGQKQWRWCNKCQGMWFSGAPSSVCPAGGSHNGAGSSDYCFAGDDSQPDPGTKGRQSAWRWCHKCQGMFYAGSAATAGSCPAGGPHENNGSSDYRVFYLDEPVLTAPPSDAASKVQVGWEWCKKCQGLFFGGGEEGACPAGDGHDSTGSQNYALYVDATVTGQKKWRWCNKCQGMWFSGTATSACPAGGGHTGAESGDYCIATDDGQAAPSNGSRQSGWRWCYKCQGMFFAGSSATAGSCPSGGPHENKGSSDYRMIYMINDGALDAVDGCADNDLSAELREAAITAAINENPDNASTSFDDESVNMVAAIRKLWKRGRTLHVRFIGGHPELHQYVRSYATIWSQHANIKFAFDNRLNAEIRVSFRRGGGCWSYIGTDALVVPYRSATMNLDWFSAKSHPSAIRRTILHEFGHALGLLHEHQNPAAGPITWDKPRAYAYYARAMGLSQSAVDYLVFQRYSSNMTQYTAYDPYSIMCFPIPRELAYRKFWAAYNSNLSAVDRTFIGKIYPFG